MIISVHGLWFGIGAICASLVFYWLQRKVQKQFKIYSSFEDIAILLFGGLVGSRIIYVLFYGLEKDWLNLIAFWRLGLVSYGGILVGSILIFLLVKMRGYKEEVLDNISAALLFGWAIGRIGNFLARDAYGVLDSHFGDMFYGRVPIQLYEMLGSLLLFCFIFFLKKKQEKPGWVYWYVLSGYGILRFMVDFWRDLPDVVGPLNISQVFALTIFICGMIGMLLWRKRKIV